jgi:glycosyltransferase involved in cell wall biosynthesis
LSDFNGGQAGLQDDRVRVFSVQMPILGHRTFGELLRRSFANSSKIRYEAKWVQDDMELPFRVLNRVLWQNIPFRPIIDRNLDFKRFRSCLASSIVANRIVSRERARSPIDVVHLHTQNLGLLSYPFSGAIPTVYTADATNAQIAREYPEWTRWTHWPAVELERRAVLAAAAVITFSRWAAESFETEYGVNCERLHVVPVGVEVDRFVPDISLRNRERTKRILFVGNDFERKGGPLLLDVFSRRLADLDVDLHLMTNDPSVKPASRVFVHRGVEAFSRDWHELYASADLFVLPTIREAFGIAYIEALAAGLPVVGSRVGAGPEIVSPDVGFLVDPGDGQELARKIRVLLEDDELRERFAVNARARACEFYDVKITITKLEEIFVSAARVR